MGTLRSLLGRKSAQDHMVRGIAALKLDRWDDAKTELYKAEAIFFRAKSPERAGLDVRGVTSLLLCLAVVDAASGLREQAAERIGTSLKAPVVSSALRTVLERMVQQMQGAAPTHPMTPYTIGGRTVPLETYVDKEVLLSAVLEGSLDEGRTFDWDATVEGIVAGLAEGFARKSGP